MNNEELDWFDIDCREVYSGVCNGNIDVESFIAFVKEEKAQSYIDGVFRGSAYHGD